MRIYCGHSYGSLIYPIVMAAWYAWVFFNSLAIACMTSSLNLTNVFITIQVNIVLIVSSKFFFDLSDMTYTLVVYITYNMGNQDLPDIYAHALGPATLGLGHIYQANSSCPCYSYVFIFAL